MSDDTPPPLPPPPIQVAAPEPWPPGAETAPRTRIWPWVGLGCGVALIIVAMIAAGLLLLFPRIGEELALQVFPSRPGAPPPPESPRPATAPQIGPARIDSSFEQPDDAWEQAGTRISDDAYELRVDSANFDSYGLYLGSNGGVISNLDLAVDVAQVAGPQNAEYGIRLRQPGPENYLMFSISPAGYYRLVRVENNIYRSIVPWTFSPRIRIGIGQSNRLRIIAAGSRISGSINGHDLINEQDEVAQHGQLALGATTFDEGGLVVRFDNLAGEAVGQNLAEDFSDAETAPWSVGGSRIVDGQYEMFAGIGIQLLQQPQPPGSSKVSDFTLEVDATLTDGSGEGLGYGVLFGYVENFEYYGLLLLPEGGLLLYHSAPAGNTVLVPATPVTAVRQGLNQTNTIRIEVHDSLLSVTINGEVIIDNEQIGPIEGEVGMLVSSGNQSRAVARFDNFKLGASSRRAQGFGRARAS